MTATLLLDQRSPNGAHGYRPASSKCQPQATARTRRGRLNQKGDLAGLYKRLGFGVETRCCADG